MDSIDTRTVTLRRRSDETVGTILDVTGWTEHEFDKMWDGLVWKVDFAEWRADFAPERGDDQTVAEWLR